MWHSEDLDNMHKIKEIEKKQELLASKYESENVKAQHLDYLHVRFGVKGRIVG